MAEWLLEIYSEEIPARMQLAAKDQIISLTRQILEKKGLAYEAIKSFITPHRLALVVEGLPQATQPLTEEKKGPRVDAAPQAIEGFLATHNVNRDACEIRETSKGTFLFLVKTIPGQKTQDVLVSVLSEILDQFRWPKSMRWTSSNFSWVRPIRNLLSVFDKQIVTGEYLGLQTSNQTIGHRFMSPDKFEVNSFADYKEKLEKNYVILDQDERLNIVQKLVNEIAENESLTLWKDDELFREVTGLVEWPVAYLGNVDHLFMDLPKEVLTTPMRHHQKYFPLQTSTGELANKFILVSDVITEDQGRTIINGNERVLRARLSDAKFFWEQDQKQSLDHLTQKLGRLLFHQQLGTILDKVHRLQKLSGEIARKNDHDAVKYERAAYLCKSDLMTNMVSEFPELQGIMGEYYALCQEEDREISQAIKEHYLPKNSGDSIPTQSLSLALALADRMDTLVGFFAIGIQPTGSKDPYALRRAALGLIALTMQTQLTVNIKELIAFSYDTYEWKTLAPPSLKSKYEAVTAVWEFLLERFKHFLRDTQGISYGHVDAILAVANQNPDLSQLMARVKALDSFMQLTDGKDLVASYKRAVNILSIEEKKDNYSYDVNVDKLYLKLPQEIDLYENLLIQSQQIEQLLANSKYQESMQKLAMLRPFIDAFFENVVVNVDDNNIRKNRLCVLAFFRKTLLSLANFSCIES